jgi:hypothetical protein
MARMMETTGDPRFYCELKGPPTGGGNGAPVIDLESRASQEAPGFAVCGGKVSSAENPHD